MVNQTSREANSRRRARASVFTARLLENIWVNFAFRSARPSVPRISASTAVMAAASKPSRITSAGRKPVSVSSRPPTKKPTPFRAFFEPVRIATQRKSAAGASAGTTSLTALFELILVRSLAMPESAWVVIT